MKSAPAKRSSQAQPDGRLERLPVKECSIENTAERTLHTMDNGSFACNSKRQLQRDYIETVA